MALTIEGAGERCPLESGLNIIGVRGDNIELFSGICGQVDVGGEDEVLAPVAWVSTNRV